MPKEESSAAEKYLALIFSPLDLNRRIGPKQTREVQHRHAKRFADEVARLVDGDVVRGCAVAVHDENPFEAVLRDLSAKIGHE